MLASPVPPTRSFCEKYSQDLTTVEALKGALIAHFEAAIDQGVPPQIALAVVLEFAAEESARLLSPAQ